ncbi:MAG: response regulator [Candidatus Levybacteria bacterium]|nr:response regulator [Candidatus Levybacteria bacterium]
MKKCILIVEDNDDIRVSLRKILVDNNFKVLEASDGAEALSIVEQGHPDLVVLDFVIPKVSGETVCVKIKETHPEIAVIALTGKSLSSDVVRGLQIGADDYMTKPFAPEELIARIDTRLKAAKELEVSSKAINPELNKITLRESTALIAIRIIVSEIIFVVSFALIVGLISLLGSYIGITGAFSLYLVALVMLLVFNIVIIFFIVARWHFEYTEVSKEGVVRHSGIIFSKKKEKYECNFVEAISFEQSFFGKLFNYGTIELYDPALKEKIYLLNVSNPKKYTELVEKILPKKTNHPMPFIAS